MSAPSLWPPVQSMLKSKLQTRLHSKARSDEPKVAKNGPWQALEARGFRLASDS